MHLFVSERGGRGDKSVILLNFKEEMWESEDVLSPESGADPRGHQ